MFRRRQTQVQLAAVLLPCLFQVFYRSLQQIDVVLKLADPYVALIAEETAYLTSEVVMVYHQRTMASTCCTIAAYRTLATLAFQQPCILS